MEELRHHGIKGMKWGKRRFQNTDGTLTSAGKKRYNIENKTGPNDPSRHKTTFEKQHDEYVRRHGINPNVGEKRPSGVVFNSRESRDMNKLRKVVQKNENERSAFLKSRKVVGQIVDDNDNVVDTLYTGDKKAYERMVKAEAKVEKLLTKLNKKYDGKVSATAKETKEGKEFVELILNDHKQEVFARDKKK